MSDVKEKAMDLHRKLKGKLSVNARQPITSKEDLSLYYTPGVGAVSDYIAKHPEEARNLTGLNNSVAIVSDGSAVLGLGNIGPQAGLPVMEGKALLFKQFADIDGYPIVINSHTADDIVKTVEAIAPSFGGINLEDIAAPICFEVEDRLKKSLDIPVMHDDQHGTAVVVLAGLINAFKITGRSFDDTKFVIVGSGAAGTAIAKLLKKYGANELLIVDSKGTLAQDRADLNEQKQQLLSLVGGPDQSTDLSGALKDADVFVGVSKANLLTEAHVKSMNKDPIIFAMANPDPEILPSVALSAGAAVVATGRSDFPNQVNNALAFPGIFRGALDNQVSAITDDHKIKAAEAIAGLISNPTPEEIIPDVFDDRLVAAIAKEIV